MLVFTWQRGGEEKKDKGGNRGEGKKEVRSMEIGGKIRKGTWEQEGKWRKEGDRNRLIEEGRGRREEEEGRG